MSANNPFDLQIILKSHDGMEEDTFRSDSEMCGELRLDLQRQCTVSAITLTFCGQATIRWSSQTSMKSIERDETVLNEELQLINTSGGEILTLSTGAHTFPFSQFLPASLPSTLTGSKNGVTYTVKAAIHLTNTAQNEEPIKCVRPFRLLTLCSTSGEFLTPFERRVRIKTKSKNMLQCTQLEYIEVFLQMQRRAFELGEPIQLVLTATNNSREAITTFGAALVVRFTLKGADGRMAKESMLITEKDTPMSIRGFETHRWELEGLFVPIECPPSSNSTSDPVEVEYELAMKLVHAGGKEHMMRVHVVLGADLPRHLRAPSSSIIPMATIPADNNNTSADRPLSNGGAATTTTILPLQQGFTTAGPPVIGNTNNVYVTNERQDPRGVESQNGHLEAMTSAEHVTESHNRYRSEEPATQHILMATSGGGGGYANNGGWSMQQQPREDQYTEERTIDFGVEDQYAGRSLSTARARVGNGRAMSSSSKQPPRNSAPYSDVVGAY